jgi:hypothetical protein
VRVFTCPALDPPEVEFTVERERHVTDRHPDLLPQHLTSIQETLSAPDRVYQNEYNANKCAFVKWFPNVRGGKFVIVQVCSEWADPTRHWIVTAYLDSDPPSI